MSNDESMVDKVKDKAGEAWDKAKDLAGQAKDKAEDLGGRAKDKVEDVGNKPEDDSLLGKISNKIEDLIPGDSDGDGH